ncbi:MAG: polysaccharide deacetylase family protein [Actinomycetota bacterium]
MKNNKLTATLVLVTISATIGLLGGYQSIAQSKPAAIFQKKLTTKHQLSPPVQSLKPQKVSLKNILKGVPPETKTPLAATPTPQPSAQPLVFAPPPQFRGATVYRATHEQAKVIALTFDDGPSPDTLKVLEVLQKSKVSATFFCLGANLKEYPDIAKRVVKEGHAIGNHTWHHFYKQVDATTAAAEIDHTAIHIYRATGAKSFLFRPPGGRLNNGLADYAKKKNYVVVMWSIDTKDYLLPPATTLAHRVISQAHPGAIVLMHDGGGNRHRTIEALPTIISQLKQQGYRFVTVPELLQMQSTKKQETAGNPPKK